MAGVWICFRSWVFEAVIHGLYQSHGYLGVILATWSETHLTGKLQNIKHVLELRLGNQR